MAVYDRMRATWLPHVMYLQESNFSSAVVNTDAHGFRLSVAADGSRIGYDEVRGTPCNILVGNSTAFGVGATCDGNTLASALANYTGDPWFNFSGRSYSSTQELMLFQTHWAEFRKVRRIVIFSGANDLVLHRRSNLYPARYGSFFFWRHFELAMREADLSPTRRWLKMVLFPIYGDRIDWQNIRLKKLPFALMGLNATRDKPQQWPGEGTLRRPEDVVAWTMRDIDIWRTLAGAMNAELLYVLQPLGNWVDKIRSEEETELFAEVAASTRKFERALAHEFDRPLHDWFAGALAANCQKLGVNFLDMNDALSKAEIDGRWMFADYIHLTDRGYDLAGRLIAQCLAKTPHGRPVANSQGQAPRLTD